MRRFAFALTLLALVSAATTFAGAAGLVKIQQANGSIQEYPNSTLRVVGKTLRITTANKKGTIVVTDAACSYVQDQTLLRCLPYAVVLHQNGAFPIAINSGTIYFNRTQQQQTLKFSSMRVPPNGVLGLLRSVHGTYVTFTGRLDGEGK